MVRRVRLMSMSSPGGGGRLLKFKKQSGRKRKRKAFKPISLTGLAKRVPSIRKARVKKLKEFKPSIYK